MSICYMPNYTTVLNTWSILNADNYFTCQPLLRYPLTCFSPISIFQVAVTQLMMPLQHWLEMKKHLPYSPASWMHLPDLEHCWSYRKLCSFSLPRIGSSYVLTSVEVWCSWCHVCLLGAWSPCNRVPSDCSTFEHG